MKHSPSDSDFSSAQLRWDQEGRPISDHYQDFYCSMIDGLEESRYVFLQQNDLAQRWENLSDHEHFTIAETGFGTGLSFLASWQLWREQAPPSARLHFISVEKHPLNIEDLQRSLGPWLDLQPLIKQLLDQYPPACPGYHRLIFDQGRVSLTLMLGEAEQQLEKLEGKADAWFLDGFSPAKNPDMWTPALFTAVARHSHTRTTFSTFTAASMVRKGLIDAGFSVFKAAGFGKKREMLRGVFSDSSFQQNKKTWHSPPVSSELTRSVKQRRAIVIGAGIAGCASARALANRGWQVELIDRGAEAASEASGNAQGVLYAKLPATPTSQSRFHLAGYLYSLRIIRQLLPEDDCWSSCGVLQLALSGKEYLKQQKLLRQHHYPSQLVRGVDPDQASQLAGISVQHPGLFFPEAGWINPPGLCRALLDHPAISCQFNCEIKDIKKDKDTGNWLALDSEGTSLADAPILIVATAKDADQFSPTKHFPLKQIRGQVSRIPQTGKLLPNRQPQDSLSKDNTLTNGTQNDGTLKTVLCGNSYISPPWQGYYCFGATFDLNSNNRELCDEDHQQNLANTETLIPSLTRLLRVEDQGSQLGRVGFRCTSPDYLPLVGPVPDRDAFIENYAKLRNNAKAVIDTPPKHLEGLFVNLAHGSKGMITAPLAAEIIASLINEECCPLEKPLLDSLNPARFIIKDLVQRTI
ncbi:bifunctional tRNA (5-methylaminomethyl-2-thiouridine)(34)-methyltransferase MnmD/FAD-dependent 5-carboxymethylaminomethyl-2-thiouridine(34) oxidoreductase MnmC [Motiliproteus sp. MSK22-1]|uniref:bifunctional tRNA (5-methylaminomethyl-2-thiouridine)(34)-methyltransferase MnmD/FAD-dependent 5-carboxymethylaminomethyl-2-thiouridine(34) oxidoreductase MnmC n=1 Tax=Motiliproteus sp. MSK22-1 TaxID=1897630 RepID=UPI0009754652|nr:bifunctional tRNA (5-methylaminomethyl-2-thiouridine)(34)-methyltransferase MnmD/FAD-dependent 5-carboxymethylaminomethyl-2-thiouridine(34) oxidoreductase MnmC [Motiliproteus sp. MSK22-1]OMH30072.1 hypothetical protein BGP75_19270 [Motiliproteus sp. MSK22-1]